MLISSLLLLLVYGFVFTWLTIPRIAEVVKRYRIFRKPSKRDLHWRFVPKLAGLSFYVALLVVAFAFVPYVDVNRLILVLGAGAIVVYVGVRDDIYQLRPTVKLMLQLIAIAFFAFGDDLVVRNLYGFLNIYEIPVGADYFLTFFIGVFMINAFNLCDGIDGLAAMMGVVMLVGYGIIFYVIGDVLFLSFSVILIGGLFAFLRYNLRHKNKVFMGDTGSLSLGGSLAAVAIIVKHEIVLAIVGGLFVLETISVIVQVASFKLTGKRIFKMAPIHHHFEKKGWAESTIVIRFWIIAIILALVGLATLKLR